MKLREIVLLFLIDQLYVCAERRTQCFVNINSGRIQGHSKNIANTTVCQYTNIPYARNHRRFERARLKPIGEIGNKFCDTPPKKCIQGVRSSISGQENCLFLSIYSPWSENVTGSSLPVVVYLHGGTFNSGSPQKDIQNLRAFVRKGILFVTVNYRLGLFGFASLPDATIEANLGLKDQQVALEWIQQNIHYFNGDRKKVSLAGWSAGGAAVTYHLYSRQSKDLFSQALIVSGSFLNPWAFHYQPDVCTLTLCEKIGVRNCTKSELEKLPVKELIPWYSEDLHFYYFGILYPCFLPASVDGDSLISNSPFDLISKKPENDVPILMGYTSLEEGCDAVSDNEYSMRNYISPRQDVDVGNLFRNVSDFFRTSQNTAVSTRRMADMLHGVLKFAQTFSMIADSPLFLYRFAVTSKTGRLCAANEKGALHGDDMKLIFGDSANENRPKIRKLRLDLIELWINFVKFGNPASATDGNRTVQWAPYDMYKRTILHIDQKLTIRKLKMSRFYTFWDKFIACVHYRKCIELYAELRKN